MTKIIPTVDANVGHKLIKSRRHSLPESYFNVNKDHRRLTVLTTIFFIMTRLFAVGLFVFLLGLGVVTCNFHLQVEPQPSTDHPPSTPDAGAEAEPEAEPEGYPEEASVPGNDTISAEAEQEDTLQIVETNPGHHNEVGIFPLNMTTDPLRCGQVYNSSANMIYYKAFDPVMEFERCVWTIAVSGASGYTIDIKSLGQGSDPKVPNRLSITGFSKGGNQSEPLIPTKRGEYTINAHMIIIVFHTRTIAPGRNDTGFALQYTTFTNNNNYHYTSQVSYASKHYISPSPTFTLQHPVQNSYGKTPYTANELTSFVFVPKNNVFKFDHLTSLVYKKDSLENNQCADHLTVYFFYPKYNQWSMEKRFCGNDNMELIRNNEMTLIIFESDSGAEGNGFQFIYM